MAEDQVTDPGVPTQGDRMIDLFKAAWDTYDSDWAVASHRHLMQVWDATSAADRQAAGEMALTVLSLRIREP